MALKVEGIVDGSEQFAHQPQRRPAVAPTLYQHVEDFPLVIDGTPEIHPHTGDPDHHLVQMPSVAGPRTMPAQPSSDRGAKLQHLTSYRFIGDVEPAFGEQFLHVAVAQGETEIEPDRVLDDLRRKAMAAIAEQSHAATVTSERPCLRDKAAHLDDGYDRAILIQGDEEPAQVVRLGHRWHSID
jgi:hypothetical protein